MLYMNEKAVRKPPEGSADCGECKAGMQSLVLTAQRPEWLSGRLRAKDEATSLGSRFSVGYTIG
jgi:hypothetical protein